VEWTGWGSRRANDPGANHDAMGNIDEVKGR